MTHSENRSPIRQLSRRACACCGEYRSIGYRHRGRWVSLSGRVKGALCWACFREVQARVDVGRIRARVVDVEFREAA